MAPLGVVALREAELTAELGREAREGPSLLLEEGLATERVHLAFAAADREAVDAFYVDALAAGGRDNGAPGPRRPQYGTYSAYVLDPDG